MARILGYIAASLDGYVADEGDDLSWLLKYEMPAEDEHHYDRFFARIRTVVMGRRTYDWVAAEPSPWGYGGKRVFVATSSPIPNPKGPLEIRSDIDALIAELRALEDGDVWMLGGGRLQSAFIERGALDELEIYVIPEVIGGGVPLFPPEGWRGSLELLSAKPVGGGFARLHYRFRR